MKFVIAFFLGLLVSISAYADWQFQMEKVTLTKFLDRVSVILGKTFVIDQRIVEIPVTVVSQTALSKTEVELLIESVASANGLVLKDNGGVIEVLSNGMVRTASSVSSGALDGIQTKVLSIENLDPQEVLSQLRPLLSPVGQLASISDSRALVISDYRAVVESFDEVLRLLQTNTKDQRLAIDLKHQWVGDIVRMLTQASGRQASNNSTGPMFGAVRVSVYSGSNRLVLSGPEASVNDMAEFIKTLDVPSDAEMFAVISLDYSQADILQNSLQPLITALKAGRPNLTLDVTADEASNSLIIVGPSVFSIEVRKLIAQLDQPQSQVLIRGAIIEASGELAESIGFQMGLAADGVGLVSSSSLAGPAIEQIGATLAGGGLPALGEGVSLAGGSLSGSNQFAGLLQLLASSSEANLLSTPSIVALNNQAAEILVGEDVPFITGSYTQVENGISKPFTTIQRNNVGLNLVVKPQVSSTGQIRLEIVQEVSQVKPTNSAIQASDIITSKRSIKTTVMADDGGLVLLGGLLRDDLITEERRVPGLSSIPGLGAAFRSNRERVVKSNLMVFLQPTLIDSPNKADKIAGEALDQMKSYDISWIHSDIEQVLENTRDVSKKFADALKP